MSTMGELAANLVEFGGDLHTHAGWIARTADGRAVDGYRYARLEPCASSECGEACACAWRYVGRAFAEDDAVAILVEILEAEELERAAGDIMPARRAGDVLVGRAMWDGATGEWTIAYGRPGLPAGTGSTTAGGPGHLSGLADSLRRHGFTSDGWKMTGGRLAGDVYGRDWSTAP